MILKVCLFCNGNLKSNDSNVFSILTCHNCLEPKHKRFYRQTYFNDNKTDILYDIMMIDSFYIERYFKSSINTENHSVISLSKKIN